MSLRASDSGAHLGLATTGERMKLEILAIVAQTPATAAGSVTVVPD